MKLAVAAAVAGVTTFQSSAHADDDDARRGMVFTISNEANNEVLVFAASGDDEDYGLRLAGAVPTGGRGTGAGLGSQGALVLSRDRDYLFAVNAASNSVSAFSIDRRGLLLESVVPSGGELPISVTEHEGVVYVLNAGGAGNISGFYNRGGRLEPIPGSTRALSGAGTDPAQIGFSDDGDVIVVTERATNRLTSYTVGRRGVAGAPQSIASSGQTPFGFAFSRRGALIVSEAFPGVANASAVSSYEVSGSGSLELISASVPSTQTAACWVAVTPNGRFAYTGNVVSNSVSAYRIERNGAISLLAAVAAQSGPAPNDVAASRDGHRLFVLNRGGNIAAFRVRDDGALEALATQPGLPGGTTGIAAN
jgi:6-phosphogluconolactonase (cycloisomerase 2 family)